MTSATTPAQAPDPTVVRVKRAPPYQPDRRAVRLLRTIHFRQQARQQPDEASNHKPIYSILFGSRARGDYQHPESDIDILLIATAIPDARWQANSAEVALHHAEQIYGHPIEVTLIWQDLETFKSRLRFSNSIENAARKEGVIMPSNPEDYPRFYDREDDDPEDETYDWSTWGERLRPAEKYEAGFNELVDSANDIMLGFSSAKAIEHGVKAIMVANGQDPKENHKIRALLSEAGKADEVMKDFQLSIDPPVYAEYLGRGDYEPRTQALLTEYDNFHERTAKDIAFLLDHARELKKRRDEYEEELRKWEAGEF